MNPTTDLRERLASKITQLAIIGSAGLGILGVGFAIAAFLSKKTDEGIQILQYVFGALLPLWGTWIGTVLAYYFGKANFEAGSKSAMDFADKLSLVQQRLQAVPVDTVMIPRASMDGLTLEEGQELAELKIMDLLSVLSKLRRKRLPIFNADGSGAMVLHNSSLDHCLVEAALDSNSGSPVMRESLESLTLGQAAERDSELAQILSQGIAFVQKSDSLLQAQERIKESQWCNDVFVTQSGSPNEPVLGWITNVIIAEQAKLG